MASAGIFHETWSDVTPIDVTNAEIDPSGGSEFKIFFGKKWVKLKPVLPIDGTTPIYINGDFETYTNGDYVITYYFLPIIVLQKSSGGRWFSVSTPEIIQKVLGNAQYYASPQNTLDPTFVGVSKVLGVEIPALPNDVMPDGVEFGDGIFPTATSNNSTSITIDEQIYNVTNIQAGGTTGWANMFDVDGIDTRTVDDMPTITVYNWKIPDMNVIDSGKKSAFSYGKLGRVDAIGLYTNEMALFTLGAVKKGE